MAVNKVILLGRLTKDPEQHGKLVVFDLATNESWTDKNGNKQERVEFHKIKCFDKKADLVMQYMSKGRELYVEGRLQTDSYEKDGEKRYSTSILMTSMTFIGSDNTPQKDQHYKDSKLDF